MTKPYGERRTSFDRVGDCRKVALTAMARIQHRMAMAPGLTEQSE